ncbi:MAG: FAD/NAD(P)-binding protein [Alphaproteobacteria bacterium]
MQNNNPLTMSFVGGAASTHIALAYVLRDIEAGDINSQQVVFQVFDQYGLNNGPAYRLKSDDFFLNQPAGMEMNPFHEGGEGLPISFIEYLNRDGEQYVATDFVPRSLFGQYLEYIRDWIKDKIKELSNIELQIIPENISTIVQAANQPGHYLLTTENGNNFFTDGVVLATGHVFQPKIEHDLYIASYADINFEERLQNAIQAENVTLIGSGASMSDIVPAMERMGFGGVYHVISPYGDTGWIYNPQASVPEGEQVLQLLNLFIDQVNHDRAPADAMRDLLNNGEQLDIAPQFILAAGLKNEQVQADERLLRCVKAFYGNPLSPARYAAMEQLKNAGRLNFTTDRMVNIAAEEEKLVLNLEKNSPIITENSVIDCTVVHRGIRDRAGEIHHPLLAQMFNHAIITTNAQDELSPIHPAGNLVFVIGPPSNNLKNGIETFTPNYQLVSRAISDHIEAVEKSNKAAKSRKQSYQQRL